MSGHYRSVFAPGLFAGQVIVVTGGGSGIGRCTAHELASLGAHVVLLGRKLEKLQTVAEEIIVDGGRCSFHACDIRDEAGVQDVVQAIVVAQGRIHGLVNNAGGQYITPRQRAQLADLRTEYEGVWDPVLRQLHASGRLQADVKLARLLVFGALNWSVQWFDRRREASLDDLTAAALALFIGENP